MSGRGRASGLAHAAAEALGAGVEAVRPCSGGDINLAFRLELVDGGTAFLKTRPGADPDEYRAEAAGLRWLSVAGGVPVPEPLAVLDDGTHAGLLIDWVEPGGPLARPGQEELGRGLARTHLAGAEAHGSVPPGAPGKDVRLGEARLVNPVSVGRQTSFAEVYAGRIEGLTRQALDAGGLDRQGAATLGRLVERTEDLCGPPSPPARLHGDLWSGNVMAGNDGRPRLVDPAAYGGDAEVDLAMLKLFGSPPAAMLDAYRELIPPVEGHRDRVQLWQIQPLLVHAVLFGGRYGQSAVRTASEYLGRSA